MNTRVIKSGGELVIFEKEKLFRSLKSAGANEDEINRVWHKIKPKIEAENISTRKIFQLAFNTLKKQRAGIAARYKLKNAMRELGPSGYYFEKLMSHVFMNAGYKTKTNLILSGKCINHEVDVQFTNQSEVNWAECKFSNKAGQKVDVKVALYFSARFMDLKSAGEVSAKPRNYFPWLISNNRFTKDAMDYGECAGIKMLSWDYPNKDSLKKLIEKHNAYPITCLTSITLNEKKLLLSEDVIVCNQIDINKLEKTLHLSPVRKSKIIEECKWLS
ncbi:MAG: ATPase [Chitinophagaceae bacterium]|nr:MAG: ATPase [Chitinophagaceae bacterium]